MKKLLAFSLALSVLAGGATMALADKMPKCPACKMALTKKKDKMHTVAVKVKGKTFYCCGGCDMKKHK